MSDQIQEKPPFWNASPISETIKNNGKKITTFLAILIGFNLFLYLKLSPTPIQTVYTGSYQNDFATPINLETEGWYDLEGKWIFADGQLAHTDFLAANPALIIPLKAEPSETVYFSADFEIGSNHDAAGLRFNMWSPQQIARSHRVAIVRQGTQSMLVGGYYADSLDFIDQFRLPLDPIFEANPNATLTIASTESNYDVYLNGTPMVEKIPAFYPPGWHGFSAIGDSAKFGFVNIEVVANRDPKLLSRFLNGDQIDTGSTTSSNNAIPAEGVNLIHPANGDLEQLGWQPSLGDWSERNGVFIQSNREQADANLIYTKSHSSYQLEVDLRHLENPGGGVLFGLERPGSLNNGYLARFTDDGSGFFYGRYDSDGKFEGIDFHPSPPSDRGIDRITVINDGSRFTVNLNDEAIFDGLPHSGSSTFFGLASNKAEVVFEQAYLSTFPENPSNQSIPQLETDNFTANDLTVFSGNWKLASDQSIVQSNSDQVDHVTSLNYSTKRFTFNTTITMEDDPNLPEIGGGIIFNMPLPDSSHGGQIVRFLDGGSEIIWGYFDEAGKFVGQSGREVNLTTGNPHTLSVAMNGATFDVAVNGETIATDLPLQHSEGWLGLITFSGPVTFSQLSLHGELP